MERIEPIVHWPGGALRIERTPGVERAGRDRGRDRPPDGDSKRKRDEEDDDGLEHVDVSA